jgi:hypothetical protein
VLVKMREQETNCRRFDNTPTTLKLERMNSSMSVTVCRRLSAQDFLRDADFALPFPGGFLLRSSAFAL